MASEKRGTVVDFRRKCVIGRKLGPYSNWQMPAMNRSENCPNSRLLRCRPGGSSMSSVRGASLQPKAALERCFSKV